MEKIKCSICGSSLVKKGDFFVCSKCGVQYSEDDIKQQFLENENHEKEELNRKNKEKKERR